MATKWSKKDPQFVPDPFEFVHTFRDARILIRDRIGRFHQLLDKREAELILELDRLESLNRSRLDALEADLKRLEIALHHTETNLVTNNLVEFQLKQQAEINAKIFEIGTTKHGLDKVCLKWELSEKFFERIAEVSVFRTRRQERDTIAPLLELEPVEGERWYVVPENWFLQWKQAVNFDSSDLTSDNEVMENIPIDNASILGRDLDSVDIIKLHSDTWKQLLGWHGLAEGSYPISVLTQNNWNRISLMEPEPEPEQRVSYKIIRGSSRSNITHVYLSPNNTFQSLFDVAMRNVSVDRKLIKMHWKLKCRKRVAFSSSHSEEANLVTDFSQLIGTDTSKRFYFSVPK